LGLRVNLVHRLDRGASGCVLVAFADPAATATADLQAAMQAARKTYVALVRTLSPWRLSLREEDAACSR
jgi:23S rRNA-/tRNA-specific pseudouridylate synthase